jgi:hypothetical protein
MEERRIAPLVELVMGCRGKQEEKYRAAAVVTIHSFEVEHSGPVSR